MEYCISDLNDWLTSFAVSSLVSRRAAADSGSRAVPSVHAYRITKSGFAILPHVSFGALANLFVVAPAPVGAFLIAFRIRPRRKYTCNIA